MKYHLTIWTDDGIKREIDMADELDLPGHSDTIRGFVDAHGETWFFNWNHVLGGTIRKVEEK